MPSPTLGSTRGEKALILPQIYLGARPENQDRHLLALRVSQPSIGGSPACAF